MLLAIDIGNTNIVLGLYDPDVEASGPGSGLAENWRISSVHDRTSDEYGVLLEVFLDQADLAWSDIGGVAVSSGVPPITTMMREMIERYIDVEPVILGPGVKTGMPVRYDSPHEVGPDRIANAVGAYDCYGGPAIVVDFGTATTLDAISEDGEYLGGAIAPGVEISLEALFARAAGLRSVELVAPRQPIGKTTAEALQAGTLFGFAAQVDGMARRFEAELGECAIVATGGLASLIAPHTEVIEHVEPWLTLHGLRVIHAKNL